MATDATMQGVSYTATDQFVSNGMSSPSTDNHNTFNQLYAPGVPSRTAPGPQRFQVPYWTPINQMDYSPYRTSEITPNMPNILYNVGMLVAAMFLFTGLANLGGF